MSLPRDLDEYSDDELIRELARRADRRENGVCDYCLRPSSATACRFPVRHEAPRRRKAGTGE